MGAGARCRAQAWKKTSRKKAAAYFMVNLSCKNIQCGKFFCSKTPKSAKPEKIQSNHPNPSNPPCEAWDLKSQS
jgi:hypothetical protein